METILEGWSGRGTGKQMYWSCPRTAKSWGTVASTQLTAASNYCEAAAAMHGARPALPLRSS